MSDDPLLRHVAAMFEAERVAADLADKKFAVAPYTGERFSIDDESLLPEQAVCRALFMHASFRETAPTWAPDLPLSSSDIEKMIQSKSNRIAVVGYFARSCACGNWSSHPKFCDYVAGLLACEHTPERIRNDPQLLKEFPPRWLGGLDRSLCWGVRDRIVEMTRQLIKGEENWRRCGMAVDAAAMRSVIEQILKVKLDERLAQFLDSQLDK